MKHLKYLLLIVLSLVGYKVDAQTSASMGLNGVVEEYETHSDYYGNEYANFDTKTKRLKILKSIVLLVVRVG